MVWKQYIIRNKLRNFDERLTVPFRSNIFTGRNEVVAKVMFLPVSVILSTGGVSGRENPPAKETPLCRETPQQGDPPPGGENPPSKDTPHPPGRETPLARRPPARRTPPAGRPPARRTPPAGRPPWQGDPPHPTGMHSCLVMTLYRLLSQNILFKKSFCRADKMKNETFSTSTEN